MSFDAEKVHEIQERRARNSAAAWASVRDIVRPSMLMWTKLLEGEDGSQWIHALKRLIVIVSASVEGDCKRWLHVSLSRATSIPSWEDVREVKDAFIGTDRKAIQVLPRASEYVNINPYVLHLWHCVDGDGLPDFTGGSGSI